MTDKELQELKKKYDRKFKHDGICQCYISFGTPCQCEHDEVWQFFEARIKEAYNRGKKDGESKALGLNRNPLADYVENMKNA